MHLGRRPGFTLTELLIVMLIIGVLAGIGIAHYTTVKDKAYVATMSADLHNLATAEESYNTVNQGYSFSLAAINFVPSPMVTATITDVTTTGWAATVTHSATSITCRVGTGADSIPGVGDGVITCQ